MSKTQRACVFIGSNMVFVDLLQDTTYYSNGSTKHEKTVIARRENGGMEPNSRAIWSVERIKVPS